MNMILIDQKKKKRLKGLIPVWENKCLYIVTTYTYILPGIVRVDQVHVMYLNLKTSHLQHLTLKIKGPNFTF